MRRFVLCVFAFTAALLGLATPAHADAGALQQLADRYAPIVVVRTQEAACGEGEPYLPVPVGSVLGRPDVTLRGPDGAVVVQSPTAADIAGKGEGYYLDIPGDPLTPKCTYDQWFKANPASTQPTLYAHVATDPAHPGMLALQYWFFYVYNDWNDRHEGDWEMVQLLFNAATPELALTMAPTQVAYAQHEGSEVANWDDPKLHREGDHLVVYPGQGSHAAYYGQSVWFGKSAASGFGCDSTAIPGTRVDPVIITIPDGTAGSTGDFAWLTFTGRWGQKAPSFNNGPTGPNTKTQWSEPVTWQEEEGRADAVAIPPVAGPAATAFCALTTSGSLLFIRVLASPWLTLLAVLAVIVILVLLVRATRWRPAASRPVELRRRIGQIVLSSFAYVTRRAGALLPLGAVVAVVFGGLSWLRTRFVQAVDTGDVSHITAPRWEWLEPLSAVLALALMAVVTAVAGTAVFHVVAAERSGARIGAAGALSRVLRRPAAAVVVLVWLAVQGLLSSTLVLLPVSAWVAATFPAAAPDAVIEGASLRQAFTRSAELTRGRRWRSLATTITLAVVALLPAFLVGALVLLLTHASFGTANWLIAAVMVITVPAALVGLAFQCLDLRLRQADDETGETQTPTLGA